MRDPKEWFMNLLVSAEIEGASSGRSRLGTESVKQIARLINWLDRERRQHAETAMKLQTYSAMLADLCEVRFGSIARGAPSLLSDAHAGWACGIGGKQSGATNKHGDLVEHDSYSEAIVFRRQRSGEYRDAKTFDRMLQDAQEWKRYITLIPVEENG